jgi:hypothetical protein
MQVVGADTDQQYIDVRSWVERMVSCSSDSCIGVTFERRVVDPETREVCTMQTPGRSRRA